MTSATEKVSADSTGEGSYKTSISMPPVIRDRGKQIMKTKGFRSFSSLVQDLIRHAPQDYLTQRQ